jgi:hypothetical protein
MQNAHLDRLLDPVVERRRSQGGSVMFIRIRMVPRQLGTVERFEARDPWNGGRGTGFSVEAWHRVPQFAADRQDGQDEGTAQPSGAAQMYAIRSDIDGVERFLPTFLSTLYGEGAVPGPRLPAILRHLEPLLKESDFRLVPGRLDARVALGSLVVAMLASLVGILGGPPRLEPTSPGAWAASVIAPGQSFLMSDRLPIAGRVPAPSALRIPANVAAVWGQSWSLGWTRGATGHRAVLFPDRVALQPGSAFGEEIIVGAAWVQAPEALGLGPALTSLRARVPDLDGTTVTCVSWFTRSRDDFSTADAVSLAGFLVAALALVVALPVGGAWLVTAPQRSRNRRLAARLALGA